MRRAPFLLLASIGLSVIAAAVFFLVIVPMGSDDDLPEPPREGTRVFAGSDGWYLALPNTPVDPGRRPSISLTTFVKTNDSRDPASLSLVFTPKGTGGPGRVFDASASFVDFTDGWFVSILPIRDLELGEYHVQLIRERDQEVPVEGEWSQESAGSIEGIAVQQWMAVGFAAGAVHDLHPEPTETSIACGADPYDDGIGHWMVTCLEEDTRTFWTVDVQTGETEQIGEPALIPSE